MCVRLHVHMYLYVCVRLSLSLSLSLFSPSPPSDSFGRNQSNQSFGLGVMTSFVLRSNHIERCHLEGADSAQHTHTHTYTHTHTHTHTHTFTMIKDSSVVITKRHMGPISPQSLIGGNNKLEDSSPVQLQNSPALSPMKHPTNIPQRQNRLQLHQRHL